MTCSKIQTADHTSYRNQPSRKTHGILPLQACLKVYGLDGVPIIFLAGGEAVDVFILRF